MDSIYSLFPHLDFLPVEPIMYHYPDPIYSPPFYDLSQTASTTSSLSDSSVSDPPPVYKPKAKNPAIYQCDFEGCTKSFTRTYNLKSHRRTHTDEKPFLCNVCFISFARQHDRNRHAKLHLGIKPFACLYCQKSFARQDALCRHLKRKRNRTLPSCYYTKLRQQEQLDAKRKKYLLN